MPQNLNEGQSLELELTYLAAAMPVELSSATPVVMEDVYFPEDPDVHAHLRLRAKNDHYEITKKVSVIEGDASAHIESTIVLDQDEYEALKKASARTIIKDRYQVKLDGHDAEVDVFKGKLAGLVLIDFEFTTYEEKESFIPPKVCLVDVTQEEFVAGGVLSGKSYEDIAGKLNSFGYTKP